MHLPADVALALRATAAIAVPCPEARGQHCMHGIMATLSVLDALLVLLRRCDHEELCQHMLPILQQPTPMRPPVVIPVTHPRLKGYRPNAAYRWSRRGVFVHREKHARPHPRLAVIAELAGDTTPMAVAVRRTLRASHADVWRCNGDLLHVPAYLKRVFVGLSVGGTRLHRPLPFELLCLIMTHVGFPVDFSHAALALH